MLIARFLTAEIINSHAHDDRSMLLKRRNHSQLNPSGGKI
jgi:hypothetical protein